MLGLNFINTDQAEKQQTGKKRYPAAESISQKAAPLNTDIVFVQEENKSSENTKHDQKGRHEK